MSQITRRPAPADPNRTKVLLVRQPVRSVRASDQPDPLPMRLAIGVIVTLGVVGGGWVLGMLGAQLGFAVHVGVPGLRPEPGAGAVGGLITFAMIVLGMPGMIFRLGLDEPLWLMLGFALVAIPAASLAAARPRTPGGPAPHVLTVIFSYFASILAAAHAVVIVIWLASGVRATRISAMPMETDAWEPWVRGMQMAAAFDVFLTIAAALWVVVILRIGVPGWLRGLVAAAAFPALVLIVTALMMASATIAHVHAPRPLMTWTGLDEPQLMLGRTDHHLVMMQRSGESLVIRQHTPPGEMATIGRRSARDFAAAEP